MKTPWLAYGLIGLLAGAIAACSTDTPVSEPPGTDTAETPVEAASPGEAVETIVALTPLTADIIHTLDEDRLVGIPGSPILRESDRFGGIETVSEGRIEPDLEKIVALEPDLVLGAEGFHDKTLDRLQEIGIDTLTVKVNSWASLRALTEDLAQQMGADPQPLLNRYDACLAQAPDSAPTTLVLVSRQPLLSPNKDSWAGDFLTQFNIQNLTADLQGESPLDGYVTLSEEKVLTANPEALLIVDTGANLLEQLKGDAFWGQLKATQSDAVYTLDYFGLINPGSLASIEATCDRLSRL